MIQEINNFYYDEEEKQKQPLQTLKSDTSDSEQDFLSVSDDELNELIASNY